MTGQEQIVALRRNGYRPACVWVNDYPNHLASSLTVSLSPAETPELQDWRFTKGLTVIVSGEDEGRVRRIEAQCQAFAARVLGTVFHHTGGRMADVLALTDTEGVMTWQK